MSFVTFIRLQNKNAAIGCKDQSSLGMILNKALWQSVLSQGSSAAIILRDDIRCTALPNERNHRGSAFLRAPLEDTRKRVKTDEEFLSVLHVEFSEDMPEMRLECTL